MALVNKHLDGLDSTCQQNTISQDRIHFFQPLGLYWIQSFLFVDKSTQLYYSVIQWHETPLFSADDTQLHIAISPTHFILSCQVLTNYPNNIQTFMASNKLKLNYNFRQKSFIVIFGVLRPIQQPESPKVAPSSHYLKAKMKYTVGNIYFVLLTTIYIHLRL